MQTDITIICIVRDQNQDRFFVLNSYNLKAYISQQLQFIKQKQDIQNQSMNRIKTFTVGDYEFNSGNCLGEGAFGKVYLCRNINSKNDEHFAIKEIKLKSLNTKEQIELIRSEYRIGHKIEHENIVHVKDLIEQKQKGCFYLVLQLCDSNLNELMEAKIKTGSFFSEHDAFFIVNEICQAFKVLNQSRIIHRDLKPENIMIKDGILKIGDFGVSKMSQQNVSIRTQAGTPLYMPLQVLKGQKYTDKYDVWAFGCIFYQLLHGQLPWRYIGKQDIIIFLQKHKSTKQITEIPEMKVRKDLSFEANKLLNQCLQIDHTRRYDWKKLVAEYSEKNSFYKKKSDQFRQKFKNLIQNSSHSDFSQQYNKAQTQSSYIINRGNDHQSKQVNMQGQQRVSSIYLDESMKSSMFRDSKIVTKVQESQNLCNFFAPKKIKSVKLLYRASENEFLASKFHQKCDGIPHTLTICLTQFNKIIGGYTPLAWRSFRAHMQYFQSQMVGGKLIRISDYSRIRRIQNLREYGRGGGGKYMVTQQKPFIQTYQSCETVEDDSRQSFTFSLSNKDKFTIEKKQYAIINRAQQGPCFNDDLQIGDKGNKYKSRAQVNTIYKNPRYKQCEAQSLQRFSGNPKILPRLMGQFSYYSNDFLLLEWQVYSLQLM